MVDLGADRGPDTAGTRGPAGASSTVTGHRKLLEQLRADGIVHVFGNPGSSEEGLVAELSRFADIEYILGLQEAAITSIADGYAQATRRPAVVQLHSGVGLGSALGSLYHALRRKTPLVVLAGEAGIAYDALDAHMAVDLVAMARPVTKYAVRATDPRSLLRLLRRCLKIAWTPPWGPVFLAVPQDVLDAPNEEPVLPTVVPDTRMAPEPAVMAGVAELLASARHPVVLVGDGVSHSQAHAELISVAEALGAEIWGAMASELIVPWTHPLYRGLTGHMFGAVSGEKVRDADAVLICGTYVFPDVFPRLTSPFASGAKIVHIDLDTSAIAKNHPVTVGLASDPKLTLALLADALDEQMTDAQKTAARERAERIGAEAARKREHDLEHDRTVHGSLPLRMSAFAEELAARLPADAIIFDESLTYQEELLRWLPPREPGSFFQTPGGTLGVGIPGAIGVKLAHPDRTVLGLTGDGGAMYTYQALWTAAHHGIAAKLVVCNNRSYRLLKLNLLDYWHEQGLSPDGYPPMPPPFDVADPPIDFVALAEALGVPGQRVSDPSQLGGSVDALLATTGPALLELVLERDLPSPPAASAEPVPARASAEYPCS
jgi:benzoylformate decarboxylase